MWALVPDDVLLEPLSSFHEKLDWMQMQAEGQEWSDSTRNHRFIDDNQVRNVENVQLCACVIQCLDESVIILSRVGDAKKDNSGVIRRCCQTHLKAGPCGANSIQCVCVRGRRR